MSVFDSSVTIKPMYVPWAFDYFRMHEKMHWLAEEVPLLDDVKDWNNRLTDNERNFLTQIFRFFTQGDVDVAQGYYERYIPLFPRPELRMMMGSFANREGTHIDAYSLLIDTVGMPETEYEAFLGYKEMSAKHEYTSSLKMAEKGSPSFIEDVAKNIAVYSAFTEGLQLFSSFAMLLNFQRFGKMKGMGTIVEWSLKDESIHVEGMIKLFRTIIQENPHVWTDDFKATLYQVARDMVELENHFIDLAFEMGGIQGITAEETKQYVKYIADRRLMQLGLKANFNVTENPFPWLDYIINSVSHSNFFEKRETEYTKGGIKWGSKDECKF